MLIGVLLLIGRLLGAVHYGVHGAGFCLLLSSCQYRSVSVVGATAHRDAHKNALTIIYDSLRRNNMYKDVKGRVQRCKRAAPAQILLLPSSHLAIHFHFSLGSLSRNDPWFRRLSSYLILLCPIAFLHLQIRHLLALSEECFSAKSPLDLKA